MGTLGFAAFYQKFCCVLLFCEYLFKMPYSRYGGPPDNRNQGQNQPMPSPWAGGFPSNQQGGSDLPMNLLGSLMNSGGSGNMANLASSLVAQALQNKPGGMIIGGNHFGPSSMGQGPSGPPRGGGYMDRGRDDYRRGPPRDHHSHRGGPSAGPRRPFRNRSRSRSRDRDRGRSSGPPGNRGSRDDSGNRGNYSRGPPPQKRMRAGSPKDRAPFEIYIGNYPVRFRENDVRKLFEEHDVTVTTIRLKHDGHKVFAFAETSSEEEIQKAIKAMDSKEIHGRRLRVRSSKDKTHNDKDGQKKKCHHEDVNFVKMMSHDIWSLPSWDFLDAKLKKKTLKRTERPRLNKPKRPSRRHSKFQMTTL